MITATSSQWHFFQKGYRTPGPNGLTGPGPLNWHLSDQETYEIIATLYKFRSWTGSENQMPYGPQRFGVRGPRGP